MHRARGVKGLDQSSARIVGLMVEAWRTWRVRGLVSSTKQVRLGARAVRGRCGRGRPVPLGTTTPNSSELGMPRDGFLEKFGRWVREQCARLVREQCARWVREQGARLVGEQGARWVGEQGAWRMRHLGKLVVLRSPRVLCAGRRESHAMGFWRRVPCTRACD